MVRPIGEHRQGRDKTNQATHIHRGVGISQGGFIGGVLPHSSDLLKEEGQRKAGEIMTTLASIPLNERPVLVLRVNPS